LLVYLFIYLFIFLLVGEPEGTSEDPHCRWTT